MSADRRPYPSQHFPAPELVETAVTAETDFIPTLAVTRPVLLDSRASGRILKNIKDGLGSFDHDGAIKNRTRFYEPKDWAVTYASALTLEHAVRLSGMDPSVADIENLAGRLISRLGSELSEAGSSIPFVVGAAVELGTRYPRKHKIGMVAAGANSSATRARPNRQKRIPRGTRQILREQALCSIVLNEFIDGEGCRVLERTPFLPHISVALNKNGFTHRQFTALSKIIRPALPPVLQLGDPVIHVRTRSRQLYESVPVRSHAQSSKQPSRPRRHLKLVDSR